MHVTFDHQVFALQRYGGVSRYFVRLAQRIAARPPHTVTVVAPLHVNAYLDDLPDDAVRGMRIAAGRFNDRVARRVSNFLAPSMIAHTNPDIVHETYYAPRGSGSRATPVVLTVYDMIHERYPDAFPAGDPTSQHKRAAIDRADHILCISESTRRDLVAMVPAAAPKTSVTHLGFDDFSTSSAEAAVPVEKPYLLYVGARAGYKNFSGLLQAYAASPRLRAAVGIRCVGGAATAAEMQQMSALGVGSSEIAFEAGNDHALAMRYRGAVAFIYPSLYEGFGIPPLEAMSCACPVAASDRSSIPEICGDAAVYFDPEDIDSMRDAIERIVFDTALRATLIANGHARMKLFSWDRCAQETLDVYGRFL